METFHLLMHENQKPYAISLKKRNNYCCCIWEAKTKRHSCMLGYLANKTVSDAHIYNLLSDIIEEC